MLAKETSMESADLKEKKFLLESTVQVEGAHHPTHQWLLALIRLLLTMVCAEIIPPKKAEVVILNYLGVMLELSCKNTMGAGIHYERLHREKFSHILSVTTEVLKEFVTVDRRIFDVDVEPFHRQAPTGGQQVAYGGKSEKEKADAARRAAQPPQQTQNNRDVNNYGKKELEPLGYWHESGSFMFYDSGMRRFHPALAAVGRGKTGKGFGGKGGGKSKGFGSYHAGPRYEVTDGQKSKAELD
jgi:hypothetical protein